MIREHIRVVELQIGRRLDDDECVHHVNGDKTDNSLENLELLKKGEHSEYHRKIEPPRRRDSLGRFLGGEKYV